MDVRIARDILCLTPATVFDIKCDIESATSARAITFITAARGRACFNGDATPRNEMRPCGNETTDGYVKDYCDTQGSTDVTVCRIAYAAANSTAVTAVSVAEFAGTGENKPLNSDGSGLATVIDAGMTNAETDADANFIVGDTNALVTGLTQTNDAAFRLSVLGTANPADAISGFAVAIAEQKYYVGLLSGTTLGMLLPTTEVETTLEWLASLRVLRDTTFATMQSFKLLVELSGKTISVKTGSITTGEVFTINDGKFTDNGLLYGRITFANAGAGSLTGLIGKSGAVGIFKSNPATTANPNPVAYVGGFVAHTNVDCRATGTPFDIVCDNAMKLRLCGGALSVLNAANGGSPSACKDPDLSGAICGTALGGGAFSTGSNVFAPICYEAEALDVAFAAGADSVRSRLAASCADDPASSQRPRCTQPLNGVSGITVNDCGKNPFLKTDICSKNVAFDQVRIDRSNTCTTALFSFATKCNIAQADVPNTDTTYLGKLALARGEACATGVEGAINCGLEADGAGITNYLGTYCNAGDNTATARDNLTHCPVRYAGKNPTTNAPVTVDSLTGTALNATGTALLPTFIATRMANATDNAPSNFIVGGTDKLNLGQSQTNDKTLQLSALDESEDDNSGFAVASIGSTNSYVGLLSETNLGRPLISADNLTVAWGAELYIFGDSTLTPSFKLDVDFATNSIKIVDNEGADTSINFDYLQAGDPEFSIINGKFTNNGVIYGTVNWGTDATLTGLIGADGAVGIFKSDNVNNRYVGGFVAAPLQIVNYADWVRGHNPDATADLAPPRDQILQVKDGTLDTTGLTFCRDSDSASYCTFSGRRTAAIASTSANTRNLNTAEFDGEDINGDINDGYTFFEGYIGEAQYNYIGILDSTDLGMPFTGNVGASVQWNGNGSGNWGDFTLTITFDAAGGRLDAFVSNANNIFYRLQNARFDTGGVITGTVNLQRFTDSDPTKPIDTATDGLAYTGDSVLSGLIGEEGLVAVFAGAGGVGGFIAGPDITLSPDVRESDWARKIGEISQPVASVPRNQFLYRSSLFRPDNIYANSNDTGDVFAKNLNFHTARFNGNPLDGNASGEIRFFTGYNGGTRHYYSGLVFSDLGATLPVWETEQPPRAEWKGQFSVLQGANAVANADLTLEVNFQNRRLTAFVPVGANHYLLDAGFNADDDGFFAGTVNFGKFTDKTNRTSTNTLTPGVLTGLIGVKGAFGVFVSGTSNDNGRTITGGEGENGFAGGFVAVPVVNADAWLFSFNSPLRTTPTEVTQFLKIAGTTISRAGTSLRMNNAGGDPSLRTLDFTEFSSGIASGLDANDGLAYFRGWIGADRYSYAGIYASTNLGAPITDSGMDATWAGKLRLGGGSSARDFDLAVTFGGTTGTVKGFLNIVGSNDLSINGRFGANGVITGGAHYGSSTPTSPDDFNGTLSGIIGQDGAVGVYIINSGTNIGVNGGFVAAPAPAR